MCSAAAQAHFLWGHFGKNCHILVLFTQNLPLTGGKLQHSWCNCLDLTDLFSLPPPPAQEKQIKKRQQMVTSVCCDQPRTTLSPSTPSHLFKTGLPSPRLIHTCLPPTSLFECLFSLSFSTKANDLLPVIDTVAERRRVKPNAYLHAQACVSHN